MSATADAEARDRIRDALDTSLFIEAGAGTGKTTALVERVVALVATGAAELRHVAAITFTEAAPAARRDSRPGGRGPASGPTGWGPRWRGPRGAAPGGSPPGPPANAAVEGS